MDNDKNIIYGEFHIRAALEAWRIVFNQKPKLRKRSGTRKLNNDGALRSNFSKTPKQTTVENASAKMRFGLTDEIVNAKGRGTRLATTRSTWQDRRVDVFQRSHFRHASQLSLAALGRHTCKRHHWRPTWSFLKYKVRHSRQQPVLGWLAAALPAIPPPGGVLSCM